jgi:hypothetical protein
MMKFLSRWVAILGIASASLVYPAMGKHMSAYALPEQQAIQIFSSVPMFMITDAKGDPLVSTVPDPRDKTKKIQNLNFFVSPQDAQEALNRIRAKNPTIGSSAKITLTSLGNIFEFAKKNASANVKTQVLPSRAQLDAAMALLRQSGEVRDQGGQLVGKDGKPFPMSTPLFFVANNQNQPIGLERTIKENGKDKVVTSLPFFFSKQDAQNVLDQARKQDPKMAANTKINVTMLTNIMGAVLTSNDPSTGQFELVPPRESIEFMQRQQPAGGAAPAGRPSAAPAAPRPQAPAANPSPAAPAAPPARPKAK